jgi:hypothetical protein
VIRASRKKIQASEESSLGSLNPFSLGTYHMIAFERKGGEEMKPNVGRAILGGFAGTLAITFLMYIGAPMMGLQKMDIAAMLGSMLGGWTMGMIMHFVLGTIVFPLIYVYALFGKLTGSPAVKGLVWGAALWLAAGIVVMPMMGAGAFGMKMGGVMSAMGSLMGHLTYGALLGWIGGEAEMAGQSSAAAV